MILLGSGIFFIISFLLFSFLTWDLSLISPDEPRYAETAREMLSSGDFITPYLNGIPRLAKPILFYWLEAFSMQLFGVNEFAVRLPSVISASLLVSLSFLFGYINRFGILTAIITMTSFAIFLASKLAITDMLLNLCICSSLVFFYLSFDQESSGSSGKKALNRSNLNYWLIASQVSMAFGFLTKGPVAIFLPALIITVFLLYKNQLINFITEHIFEMLIGLASILIINLPWYILVHIQTNGEFTRAFFLSDNFNRFTSVHTGHGAAFWFYIPVVLLGLFPWSFFLLQSIFSYDSTNNLSLQSDKVRQKQAFSFCIIWALVIFLFFSISQTKLPTYILPIFLPLCFLIARWWSQRFEVTRSQNSKNFGLFWGLISFFITSLIGFLVYLFIFKKELAIVEANEFLLVAILITFFFLSFNAIGLTSVFSNAKISFAFFTIANIICLLLANAMILKPYAKYRDAGSKTFAQKLSEDQELKTFGLEPSRFSFYSKRLITGARGKDIKNYFNEKEIPYLVFRTKKTQRFKKRALKDNLSYEEASINRIYTFIQGEKRIKPALEKEKL